MRPLKNMPELKVTLGFGCYALMVLAGLIGLMSFSSPGTAEPWLGYLFGLIFVIYAFGLFRVGRLLINLRNSPIHKLTWAMILVTMFTGAVPSAWFLWGSAHVTNAFPVCKLNLQNIANAKEMWARDEGKTTNDIPTWDDINIYLGPGQKLVCPDGGTYFLAKVGTPPTCSLGGPRHTLQYSSFPWLEIVISCLFCLSVGLQIIVAFKNRRSPVV